MRRGAAALSAGCALVLTLTACGSSGGDGGGITGAVKAAGGPPAGGWPQPVNGQLTPAMCGLLTDADYAKYGHERLPVDSQKRVDGQPNAVDCLYTTEDDLNLSLQPTAQSAKVAYAAGLADHKKRLSEDRRPTVVEQAPQITGFANCMKSYTPPK